MSDIGSRRRSAKPERLFIGEREYVRNDVRAKELACTERTLNRGDARGAPYQFFGGVKYRPVEEHNLFVLSGVQRRNQPPEKRRGRR